jgi:hypothetical protein
MRRLLRWYGANPLHLLALIGCFLVAGYAADRLVPSNPLGVGIWFLGAVVGHDLVLMPLYSLADWPAAAVFRHHPAPSLPSPAWAQATLIMIPVRRVFFAIEVCTAVSISCVTAHPDGAWTVRQARNGTC